MSSSHFYRSAIVQHLTNSNDPPWEVVGCFLLDWHRVVLVRKPKREAPCLFVRISRLCCHAHSPLRRPSINMKTTTSLTISPAAMLAWLLLLLSVSTWVVRADDAAAEGGGGAAPSTDDAAGGGEEEEPFHNLWVAHGLLMAISWAILLPIGIGCSLLRSIIPGHKTWFQLHMACNTLAFLLITAAFGMAVYVYQQEEDDHFQERHQAIGLALYLILFVQVLVGILRPHLPHPQDYDEETGIEDVIHPHHHHHDHDHEEEGVAQPKKLDDNAAPEATAAVAGAGPAPPVVKSTARKVFEVFHPLLGAGLMGLAWYNLYLGIEALVEFYGPSYDKTKALWGVIGGLCGTIFVAYVGLKLRARNQTVESTAEIKI